MLQLRTTITKMAEKGCTWLGHLVSSTLIKISCQAAVRVPGKFCNFYLMKKNAIN